MTSSFTGMTLAALLALGLEVDVDGAARAGSAVLDTAASRAEAVAATGPARLVYLGSGVPIELSDVWLRGDRFRLSAMVKRYRDGVLTPSALELY